jgi:hypothetical protein
MTVEWVQDLRDDTNASPAFEVVDGEETYLYIGATVDKTIKSDGTGKAGVYKLNARSGEIIWQYDRTVHTTAQVTGGAMGSPILGEHDLSDLVFFNFASIGGGENKGSLIAFRRLTGEVAWELNLGLYTWSSPLAIYDANGKGYIVQCDSAGRVWLIDGQTGEVYDKLTFGGNMEASPSAFDNILIIGTRTKGIFGIRVN